MRPNDERGFSASSLLEEREDPQRIARPQLEHRLTGAATAWVTVLVGPAGVGKTDLLRASLGQTNAIYFRVGNEGRTFARFIRGLASAVAPLAPGALASFPRAWERALQSRTPGTVLAHWLCEHLDGIDRHIVIDDLHAAAGDTKVASFIAKLVELRPSAPLTIAVQSVGALPIALWMATRRMDRPINEGDLRFSRREVAIAADRFGVALDAIAVEHLLAATGGLPITVAYALIRLRCAGRTSLSASMPTSFKAVADEIFHRRTEREREFLWNAALLPNIEDDALRLAGWGDPEQIRTGMGADGAFMWEGDSLRGVRFHDRFRDYLLERFGSHDSAVRSAIVERTIQSLLRAERQATALELATRQRHVGAIAALLDGHGFKLLEYGEVGVITEALEVFADADQSLGPNALALRGYIEARLGHLDTAEAWFRLGLDSAPDESSRAAIAIYYARELSLQRRDDACSVLEPFVGSTTLPRNLLSDVRSSFAQALIFTGRLEEATSLTDETIALLDEGTPPTLRVRAFARGAFVALQNGNPTLARERALIAAPLAIAQGLYDAAGSVYSVLYNIAYDFDDDAIASLEYVRCGRDVGLKSGTLGQDLLAMLCSYELYAEAGNEPELAALDQRLSALDKHEFARGIMEGVAPAKALQAAWSGHFDDAQRLLESTAEHLTFPAKIALRWAQIGLYRAAAGRAELAAQALRSAENTLPSSDKRTTQYALTLLNLALAALVTNDVERADRWLRAADEATLGSAPRSRALHRAVQALIAGFEDAGRFTQDVPAALAALRGVSFGGMAKLIEALPYRSAKPGAVAETIGQVLAQAGLPARFAAAITAQDSGPLLAWLDTIPGPTFGDTLLERFDRWSAEPAALGASSPREIKRVRNRLAAYSKPTPAIMRMVDDVDVLVETLFIQLEASSPLMGEHSRAVSAWCSRLARTLGLSEAEIAFVTRCGLVHDVGKVRTPAEILNAPRQLTPAEWSVMRDHSVEGERILGRLPALHAFVPIVRGHHERLDGKGYPDGLRANAIPLAARIVTVADCFNAMIGRRPYRLPMLPTNALDELERHRGTQFDPEVVHAMIQIVLGRFV